MIWAPRALLDIAEIHAWLAERNPDAARRMATNIREATAPLARFPEAGRALGESGIRMWVVPGTPFVIDYRLRGESVEILAVTHGARRR